MNQEEIWGFVGDFTKSGSVPLNTYIHCTEHTPSLRSAGNVHLLNVLVLYIF